MPWPKKGEKKNSYISRAVKEMVDKEGLTPKNAVGKAEGMWDQKRPVPAKKTPIKSISKGKR